jgi:hypothetical protein
MHEMNRTLPFIIVACIGATVFLTSCRGAGTPEVTPIPSLTATPNPTPSSTSTATKTASPAPTPTLAPSGQFIDNGDGTITDRTTGLQWEKKGAAPFGIHDVTLTYTWDAARTTFIGGLNAGQCLGNGCDWRLPTIDELKTLATAPPDYRPAIDPVFYSTCMPGCSILMASSLVYTCSCDASGDTDRARVRGAIYWSSTETSSYPHYPEAFDLYNGNNIGGSLVTARWHARAVRGQ